jgi:hypothetical protein
MKKWWVKLLLAVAAILLILCAWLFNSGAHSKNAVERYKDQLRASGEKLNLDEFIPPRADADKNGVALFEEAVRYMAPRGRTALSTNPPLGMTMIAPGKALVDSRQNEIVLYDRHAFITNTWAVIEGELVSQSSAIDFLQQAAQRPRFDFQIEYGRTDLRLPHISDLRRAASLLSPAAIFDLHRGETASAVTNLHTLLGMVTAWNDEPLIISQIVRGLMLQSAIQTQWELLQATNLADAQLASLQTNWMNIELLQPMQTAFEMSRCLVGPNIKDMRGSLSPGGGGPSFSSGGGWRFDPRGFTQSLKRSIGTGLWRASWCFDDELMMLEGNQLMVETMRQIRTNGYFKDALAERQRKLVALGLDRPDSNWIRKQLGDQFAELGANFASSTSNYLNRVLLSEAWRKVAIVAIALKRYELRHGTLPKNLNALVPEFLAEIPSDPMDGKPLRYRLNPDGTFLLYSIGRDGVDDGGDPTFVAPAKTLQWQSARDWVWPQPATAVEIQHYYDHPPN